jgi:hypothetical protein
MNLSIGTQWLTDITYFLIVIVMLLNIVFGIIIDTFSSLRAEKLAKLENTLEVCFICSIDKQTFDRASDEPDGFLTHVKLDHNMWNYMYYIFMLWEQDRDDDDGLEQYVRRAIEADEIIWFPLNKAIRLDQAATEEEETLQQLTLKLNDYEALLSRKLSDFQVAVNNILEQVSSATRQDYEAGKVKNGIAQYLKNTTTKEISTEEALELGSEVLLLDDELDERGGKGRDDDTEGPADGDEEGIEGSLTKSGSKDSDGADNSDIPFRPSWLEKADGSGGSRLPVAVRSRFDSNADELDSDHATSPSYSRNVSLKVETLPLKASNSTKIEVKVVNESDDDSDDNEDDNGSKIVEKSAPV